MKKNISAVIIAKNEQENLLRCLKALDFCQEIVVVTNGDSKDKTGAVAKKLGARVFSHKFSGFGPQKNYAISKAKGDWILSLDADEEISAKLHRQILKALARNSYDGFFLLRQSWFLGKPIKHSGWFPEYKLRLVRKNLAKFDDNLVHEDMLPVLKTAKLSGLLLHYSYRTFSDYIQKMVRYTNLQARQTSANPFILFLKPCFRFFKMYFAKLGFLDGWRGLVLAIMSAYYELLVFGKVAVKRIKKSE